MKHTTPLLKRRIPLPLGLLSMAACAATSHAAIVGINAGTSFANIAFNDTAATGPGGGGGLYGVNTGAAWNGAPLFLLPTTDLNTSDTASIGIAASFAPFSYLVSLTPAQLTQPGTTVGISTMTVNFSVDYLLDGGGLPAGPTFAGYRLFGNILALPGSFVDFDADLFYSNNVLGLMDTLNLNYFNNVPGAFNQVVVDAGVTPVQPAFSVMTLSGSILFRVDPADFNAEAVPEPSAAVLSLLPLAFLARRRR